jgi:hypothetical protein
MSPFLDLFPTKSGYFIARVREGNMAASGDTPREAIENLGRLLDSLRKSN